VDLEASGGMARARATSGPGLERTCPKDEASGLGPPYRNGPLMAVIPRPPEPSPLCLSAVDVQALLELHRCRDDLPAEKPGSVSVRTWPSMP